MWYNRFVCPRVLRMRRAERRLVEENRLSLLKVHRLLIGSGIAMCVIYMLRQLLHYWRNGALVDLMQAVIAIGVAIVLGLYFRTIPAD